MSNNKPTVKDSSEQTQSTGGEAASKSPGPTTGLTQLEDRFRTHIEHTSSSLSEQASAFDAVMQMAVSAVKDRSTLTAEKSALRSTVEELTEERDSLRGAVQTTTRDRNTLQSAKEALEKKHTELTATHRQLKEQLEAASQANKQLTAANGASEQQLAKASESNKRLQALVAETEEAKQGLLAEKKAVEHELAEIRDACRRMEARAESAESANNELQSSRQSLQSELAETTANCQSFATKLESVEGNNRHLRDILTELESEVTTHRSRVSEVEGQLEAASREQQQTRSINAELNKEIADLKGECQGLREQAEAADQEQAKLQETRQTLETCLADLSARAMGLESDRKHTDVSRATEKELATLRARVKELESGESEVAALQQRIAELEPFETEVAALQQRISEVESGDSDVAGLHQRIAELESGEQELAALRQRIAEVEARESEINVLWERIAELESEDGGHAALRERIAELESGDTDHGPLRERITELESMLQGVKSQPASSLGAEEVTRDLAAYAKCANYLVQILQKPKIDANRQELLLRTAADLAVQLGILKTTGEMSRADAVVEMTSDTFNLVELLKSSIESFEYTTARKGLSLTTRMDPTVPESLHADRARLQQLLDWSMTCMMRHAAEGEVAATIEVKRDEGKNLLQVHLYNNGTSLSQEQQGSLSSLQSNDPEKRGIEATAFSRLAEAMGGSLVVEAAGKQGFAVRLSVAIRHSDAESGDRRDTQRVLQQLLQCNLGSVVDLSPAGIRVLSPKVIKGRATVEIPGGPKKLRAQVVWTNKLDRRQFEVGLLFTEIKPEEAEQLISIAQKHGLAVAAA